MTKVIIKSEDNKETEIDTFLPAERIKRIIEEIEEKEKTKEALNKLFGILKTNKSIEEIREEIYEEIYNRQ